MPGNIYNLSQCLFLSSSLTDVWESLIDIDHKSHRRIQLIEQI